MTTVWRTRLILASPLLGALALAVYSPTDDGPTICPFALITGSACPGCGMTRAFGYLARGDLVMALRYHPLVMLVAAQALAGWMWFAVRSRRADAAPISTRITSAILVGTAVSLVAVWLLRMAAGALPPV